MFFYRIKTLSDQSSLLSAYALITSAFMAAAVATTMATAVVTATMTAAMATFLTFLWYRLGLQWLQFELRNFALTAAWPHTRPLAKAFLWRLLAALTTWIVNTCSKGDWECHRVATTTTTSASTSTSSTATAVMAHMWASKATATIAASAES